jgi:hypothetical protein
MSAAPEILFTYVRDGRPHLIVQHGDDVAQVMLDPVWDAGSITGYRAWFAFSDDFYPTPQAARRAALRQLCQRLRRSGA